MIEKNNGGNVYLKNSLIIPDKVIFGGRALPIIKIAQKYISYGYIVITKLNSKKKEIIDKIILRGYHPNSDPLTGIFCCRNEYEYNDFNLNYLEINLLRNFYFDNCYDIPREGECIINKFGVEEDLLKTLQIYFNNPGLRGGKKDEINMSKIFLIEDLKKLKDKKELSKDDIVGHIPWIDFDINSREIIPHTLIIEGGKKYKIKKISKKYIIDGYIIYKKLSKYINKMEMIVTNIFLFSPNPNCDDLSNSFNFKNTDFELKNEDRENSHFSFSQTNIKKMENILGTIDYNRMNPYFKIDNNEIEIE